MVMTIVIFDMFIYLSFDQSCPPYIKLGRSQGGGGLFSEKIRGVRVPKVVVNFLWINLKKKFQNGRRPGQDTSSKGEEGLSPLPPQFNVYCPPRWFGLNKVFDVSPAVVDVQSAHKVIFDAWEFLHL